MHTGSQVAQRKALLSFWGSFLEERKWNFFFLPVFFLPCGAHKLLPEVCVVIVILKKEEWKL